MFTNMSLNINIDVTLLFYIDYKFKINHLSLSI